MNTIEFNKNYTKLPAGIKTAVLVACEPIDLQKQQREFLCYDTNCGVNGHSPFPHIGELVEMGDNLLCLILKSDSGAIFTTLRKDNSENREKYMAYKVPPFPEMGDIYAIKQIPHYGKEFEIIIKEG